MHEVGIAQSIIEIAENAAHDCAILKIHLKLGAFTGVVRESLEFAFEALRKDTPAGHALLEIETIPLICACPACGWSGPPEESYCLICPRCSVPVNIISGREMQVEYVDLGEPLMERVTVETKVLSQNGQVADSNRRLFEQHGIAAVNFMSAPGAGKTSVLERTLRALKPDFEMAVIEGDLFTTLDADRIQAAGVPAYQITTGTCCHLDARMIARAY